jgi:hypothetical protein
MLRLASLIFRNVFRNRRRSLLTLASTRFRRRCCRLARLPKGFQIADWPMIR